MNLDRFAYGPDPAEAKVKATCAACGGEIYEDEDVFLVDGDIVHWDNDCLDKYLRLNSSIRTMSVEEALRERSA